MTHAMNSELRTELLAMARADADLRAHLVSDGSLFAHGYHPLMAALHSDNAKRLSAIIDQHGWPCRDLVGTDGVRAAWLVVQHAIGEPAFMRRCLPLVEAAMRHGEIDGYAYACLVDRIRIFEGRPQWYGTHADWDEHGVLSLNVIEDASTVDARRAALGLCTTAERLEQLRQDALRDGQRPPTADQYAKRVAEFVCWAQSVGWR